MSKDGSHENTTSKTELHKLSGKDLRGFLRRSRKQWNEQTVSKIEENMRAEMRK